MKKYQYLASWDDQTLTRVGEPVVVLGDSNVSQVEVTLPSNFLLDPTKAECRMYFLLPGEKESNHDVLETAVKDENGDSHVTWTIKHVHSQKGGRLAFSLTIIGDDAQWDSRTAIIPVYESRYQPESEEAEKPYTGRLDALEGSMASIRGEFAEVQEDFEDLKETATLGTPIPESLVANMTEGHVYIYTGTEPGYTAGHVYYYVDGVLKDGGVYGGTAVDATLTQSGQAADAKKTGDEISQIKEDLIRELKNTFTVPTTYTFIANASYWTIGVGIKPSTGANQTSDKQCRTAYITIKGRTLLYIDNPNYNFVVWEYTADNVASAIYSPSPAFGSDPVIIADDAGATKFRVGVIRKDMAVITEADISILTSAVKTFLLTDETLTIKGSPADAKKVGDSFKSIRQSIEQIPGIPQPFPSDGKKADAVSFYESFDELADWQTITGNQFFEYGVVAGGYVDSHITDYQNYALRAYYLNGRMEYIGYNGAEQDTSTNYYKLLSPYTDDPNAEAVGTSLYPRKKVLIVAGMHGDEGATPNILREFVRELIYNPEYADILTSYQFCFIPLANPYGYSLDRRDCRYYDSTTGQIETKDMNGDFPQDGTTQVLNESKFVKQIFLDGEYDIVFDLHQHNFDTSADTTTHKLAFGGVTIKAQSTINEGRYYRVIAGGSIHAQNTIRGMFNIDEDAQTMFAWGRDTTHTNTFREYAVGTRDTFARHKAEMAAISETSTCCFIYSNTHTKYNQLAMTVCKEYDTAFIVGILRKFIEE